MEQIGTELRRLLMAGIGAASTTVEKAQELIGKLAEKGEITYEQAKTLSQDVADKVKKAVDESGVKEIFLGKSSRKEMLLDIVDELSAEDLESLRLAIEEKLKDRREKASACCCTEEECAACHFESGDKADCDCGCCEDKQD